MRPDRLYEIDEAGSGPRGPVPRAESRPALFADASPAHAHRENPYPDFSHQPLHPYRLSRLGPGVGWFDADGDGLDDLVVGNGAWVGPTWLRNVGGELQGAAGLETSDLRDAAGIVGWWEDGVARLAVGRSSHEREVLGPDQGDAVVIWEFADGRPRAVGRLPAWGSSPGPLALGDVNGDGRLDLFVGGRSIRDRWPAPASSRIFLNRGDGQFTVDEASARALDGVGLVTGAVFTDLDGDGRPELVVAREWGTLMVWAVRDGGLADVSGEWGVPQVPGWWNGVTTGDLDGDGHLDLVATNWGRNHLYAATSDADHPTRIRYGDLAGDGVVQVIETYEGGPGGVEVPRRSFSILWSEFPFIQDRVKTYETFAASSVEEIFGGRLAETSVVEAGTFDHVVLFNRGGRFEAAPLPDAAQRAPAFHASVADFDGDGREDVFVSQNFFSYQLETPRSDAGRGLLLLGDGRGGLEPAPGATSGILVWGEQRGAATADVDGDGRVDVAVAQNGAATRVFRNRGATPGLRVRLRGAPANGGGVGAQLRLETAAGLGPVREIHAGSGYWSMDSAIQVLTGAGEGAATLRVRWPGGEEVRYDVPAGAREVVAGIDGSLEVLAGGGP